MKKLLALATLGLACAFGSALAADATTPVAGEAPMAKAPTGQQSKMKTCNLDAKGMKGDERKTFMKTCLSKKSDSQQSRMKTCNMEAGDKKGPERKTFMSECLKK